MKQTEVIFNKTYDGESLYDLSRDIDESLQSSYNPIINEIPSDEHGFLRGTFVVNITWFGENYD